MLLLDDSDQLKLTGVLQFLLKGADLSSEELADIRGLVGKLEASSKGTSEGEGDS